MRLPADRRARDRRGRRLRDAALRRRRPALERARSARRSRSRPSGCRRCTSRPRSPAPATSRRARSASASSGPGRSRSCSAPPASSSPRCRATGPTREARVHVFCHAVPGHLGGDGRDALRRRLAALAARRRRRRRSTSWSPRRRAGPPGTEGLTFLPYLQGERTPHADPDARGRVRRDSRCATTAARSSARCSRASPTGCATRSSCCASSASSPTVGRVSGGGARSELWLKIVASVLGIPLERTAVEEGAAYGAALLGGVAAGVFADAHEAVARVRPRARHGRARPRVAARLRRGLRAVHGRSTRPYDDWRSNEPRRQGRVHHRREPRDRRRGRALARRRGRDGRARLAQRRRPRPRRRRLGLACDVRDPEEVDASVAATVERFGRLDIVVANAGVGAYGPFLDLSPRAPRGDDRRQPEGDALRGARRAAAPAEERRGGHRHARVRGRPARAAVRGRLLRVEVRPGRLHARARPRAARAGRPLHERLPGRRRHRLRARGGPRPDAGRRCRG